MKSASRVATCTWILCLALPVAAAEVVYETDFDSPAAVAGWTGLGTAAELAPGVGGSQGLSAEIPTAEGTGHRSARIKLPLAALCGTRVRVEAMVRAETVSQPPNPWNGVKVMLHTTSPAGDQWQQQNSVFGTFDWKPVRFLAAVPRDATAAELILGLESVTGRAWFDNLKITVVSRRRPAGGPAKAGPVYKGHALDRLRGAMIGPRVGAEDLRVLGGQWKANHVRWQLIWGGFPHGPADRGDLAAYDAWLDSELERLDSLLPVCEEMGILVLIDLHTPPGGRNEARECRLFKEARFQQAFLKVWEKIAARYRDSATVWGYDLVNEPVEGILGEGVMDWHGLATAAARRIRKIDPEHAIIVEPAPWGSPEALELFEPIEAERVVYSVHIYQPHQFTHQGVYDAPVGITYPGEIGGRHWDKETIRRALRPAIDYQRDYGVQIYIGEFSAIRWAPGSSAHDYLRDVIEVMEENGWDWAYHAFREWDGWSVEHGPDKQSRARSEQPTDRQKLLMHWFEKNERPQDGAG
ncbi:MAG: cellulase family glycosylhydrolase [Pirellulales bacterium]|mgnify:CR=1 FL=1|nr:cellulase family glycosylhydrolase [Thermoguttaceae bacterium]MDD4787081.1 cellulase family glycosylhydrolase [Pirellulales bacterium]MDI9445085.1 cellulase family glycosylhydrolase [Planctomycetota bacterium]NLY99133.1 glycoside hydrolase family 5 protein [Pirellulaceae bacterium]